MLLSSLKEAHKKQDIAGIDSAMTALNAAWTAASQDIYNTQQQQGAAGAQQQQQQPGPDGAGAQQQQGANAGGENVTDVPYEEVK